MREENQDFVFDFRLIRDYYESSALHEVVICSFGVRSARSLDVKTSSHPPWHNGKLLCHRRTRHLALERQNGENCARPEVLPCCGAMDAFEVDLTCMGDERGK